MKWIAWALTAALFLPGVYAGESNKQIIQQHLSEKQLDDAEDIAENWVENEPDNAAAWHTRGIVMAQQAQDAFFSALSYAGKSLESFEKAVTLDPTSLKYRTALMQFYLMAPSMAGGDDEKALAQIEAIEKIDPAQGMLAKIGYFQQHEQDEQASELLKEALANYPNNADVLVYAGFQEQRNENYEKALSLFEQAVAGESAEGDSSVMALYQIGRTSVLAETQLDDGIQALRQYLKSELPENVPGAHWANFRLAQLLTLKGNKEESQQLLAELKEVDDKELQKQISSWN
ncbi:MAG: tetratricopeptide repeat protein [Pseudomonadota bacterium]